jgi:hypothetical protein
VPLRTAPLSQLAPARPFSDTRRRLVAVLQGRHASSNGHVATEPGFRSPWGELERQIPYVVITTQPWPAEWWRPRPQREAAAMRATAQPMDLLARPAAQAPAQAAIQAPEAPVGIKVWDTPAHTTAHDLGDAAEPLVTPAPSRPSSVSHNRAAVRRRARPQQDRRGLFARLAVLAVGLIVSLIAVETASRRRS